MFYNFIKSTKLILLLLIGFATIGCGSDDNHPIENPYTSGEEVFDEFLSDTLNKYVEDRAEKLLDEQTAFFSLQPIRMVKHTFWVEDSVRKEYWINLLPEKGLCSDSIQALINGEIEKYNNENKDNQLSTVEIAPFYNNDIIDETCYNNIKLLDMFGAYDVIDLLLGCILSIIFGTILGAIIGAIFGGILGFVNPDIVDDEERFTDLVQKWVKRILNLIWIGLFVWYLIKYLESFMELQYTLSNNIINSIAI